MRQYFFAKIPGWILILLVITVGIGTSFLLLFSARASAAIHLEKANSLAFKQNFSSQYLGDADMVDAPYGITPTVNGIISPGEYAGAGKIVFPGYNGDIEAFVRQNASSLFISIDSPDTTPYPISSGGGTGPAFQIILDTNNDKSTSPQTDDYQLILKKDGSIIEYQGDGSGWGNVGTGNWNAASYSTFWGWQAEFEIAFSKLGITPPATQTIGFSITEVWTSSWPQDGYWPENCDCDNPSSWGNLSSSSYWDTFYWKPAPYEDYSPSGIPDFAQFLADPTYAGPSAAANSFWWLDSQFEKNPEGLSSENPPAILPISDSYTLVEPYGNWDDHDPQNVLSFTLDLANNYFGTNQLISGTHIYNIRLM